MRTNQMGAGLGRVSPLLNRNDRSHSPPTIPAIPIVTRATGIGTNSLACAKTKIQET